MYKVVRFLEAMWLMIAIFCIVTGTYKIVNLPSIQDGLFFYIFSILAIFLFFLRRRQRKNMEKENNFNKN